MKKIVNVILIVLFGLNIILTFFPIINVGNKYYSLVQNNGVIFIIISILEIVLLIIKNNKIVIFLNFVSSLYLIIFFNQYSSSLEILNLNFSISFYVLLTINIITYILLYLLLSKNRNIKENKVVIENAFEFPKFKTCKYCGSNILESSKQCFFCNSRLGD